MYKLLLGLLLALFSLNAYGYTCEKCEGIEQEKAKLQEERIKLVTSIKEANKKRDLAKVQKDSEDLNKKVKKLEELSTEFNKCSKECEYNCEDCKDFEKTLRKLDDDLGSKDVEMLEAHKKQDSEDMRKKREEIENIKKQKGILLKKLDTCEKNKDKCKPDVVKKSECVKLMKEIQVMEEKSENIREVDRKYQDLSRCVGELQQLKKTK